MRAVVQRVTQSSVRVDSEIVGQVGAGLAVLVGVKEGDGPAQARWIANKVATLRIFPDEAGKFDRSVLDMGGGVLVVSQFTLYGDPRHGRRPDFTKAARPEVAEPLIEQVVRFLKEAGVTQVETGRFGAHMLVEIHNDGPVTILLDTEM